MTQPQQGQLIVCQVCGVPRINGPWLYLGVPKLALVSIQSDQLKPCPVCVLLAAVAEMRDHIIAIEKEMQPEVEDHNAAAEREIAAYKADPDSSWNRRTEEAAS